MKSLVLQIYSWPNESLRILRRSFLGHQGIVLARLSDPVLEDGAVDVIVRVLLVLVVLWHVVLARIRGAG